MSLFPGSLHWLKVFTVWLSRFQAMFMMFVKKKMFFYVKHVIEHFCKKIVTTVVCCLSCVKFLVNLFGVVGMKKRIFIEYNCQHLRSYYSFSYNEWLQLQFSFRQWRYWFFSFWSRNEELITNQFQHSFCFTELRLYYFPTWHETS